MIKRLSLNSHHKVGGRGGIIIDPTPTYVPPPAMMLGFGLIAAGFGMMVTQCMACCNDPQSKVEGYLRRGDRCSRWCYVGRITVSSSDGCIMAGMIFGTAGIMAAGIFFFALSAQ